METRACIICERQVPLDKLHQTVSPLHSHPVFFCIDTADCLMQAPIKAPIKPR